jgi:ATP-dependent protease HslVU (ClpYQ) peptidase subunit
MTCIAAIRHDGKVYVGGDGRDTCGSEIIQSDPKVWVCNGFAMGHSGTAVACQVSKFGFVPTTPTHRTDLMKHMVSVFVPELRKELTDAGLDLSAVDSDGDYRVSLSMVVGVHGRLFTVEEWSVNEFVEFAAGGSGAPWAQGSLRETRRLAPRTRLQRALSAAAAHNTSVGPPFTFVSV